MLSGNTPSASREAREEAQRRSEWITFLSHDGAAEYRCSRCRKPNDTKEAKCPHCNADMNI